METNPFSTATDFTPELIRQPPQLSPQDQAACDSIVARMAHFVKTRQVDIRP
eukprot:CAMPEP_0115883178 /NCGR_PEP_ID=MMETSP0287-20121206/29427_1 /TAXON_ID=412157 /ORGANISM="Chrysochromulina rotalis, Strain UIO044" /LENGTH=51 /DNA_ID=CAMNT_0003339361 /DNA_START=13 /DNA_END=164 /DNA_ORIENTATION=-